MITVTAPVKEVPVAVKVISASVAPTLAAIGVNAALLVTTMVPAAVMVEAVFTSTPAMVSLSVVAEANSVVVRNWTEVIMAPAGDETQRASQASHLSGGQVIRLGNDSRASIANGASGGAGGVLNGAQQPGAEMSSESHDISSD